MPALDKCHDIVERVLQKAGWQIETTQLALRLRGTSLHVDIRARRISEDNDEQILVVEAKCFSQKREQLHDLYSSIGQYLVYRNLMHASGMPFPLYLAIPVHAYQGVFQLAGMSTVRETKINLIVFDMVAEEIVEWVNW
jgi:hypothetical protein